MYVVYIGLGTWVLAVIATIYVDRRHEKLKALRLQQQEHYVELCEEAYAAYPLPDYFKRLDAARTKLVEMQGAT